MARPVKGDVVVRAVPFPPAALGRTRDKELRTGTGFWEASGHLGFFRPPIRRHFRLQIVEFRLADPEAD